MSKLRRYLDRINLDIVIQEKSDSSSDIGARTSRFGDAQGMNSMVSNTTDYVFSDTPVPGWSREKTLAIKRALAEKIKPRLVSSLVSAGSITIHHRDYGFARFPILDAEIGGIAFHQHGKLRIMLVPKSRSEQRWVMYLLTSQEVQRRWDLLAIVSQGHIMSIGTMGKH